MSEDNNIGNESYSNLAYEDRQFSKLMIIILLVLGVVTLVLIAANVVSGYTAEISTSNSSSSSALASSEIDSIIQNIANRPDSADDLSDSADTLFASGEIDNSTKCYTDSTYDSFGNSVFDEHGLTINNYDSNKWYVSATADSAYVNQNSLAVYITQGNNTKGATNVISNKQLTGDFDMSITLKNLPKSSEGWAAFRLGVWFGLKDYSLYTFRNQQDELEIFFAYWDGTQLVYYNPTGNSSYSNDTFGIKVKDESQDIQLELARKDTALTASVTNSSETQIVGTISDVTLDDIYIVHGLNVGGTNNLEAAVADDFKFKTACFK